MPEIIGHKPGKWENRLNIFLILVFCGVLFVIMSQPVWRGEEMVAEFKEKCAMRGGILYENEKMFGIEYQCLSRMD